MAGIYIHIPFCKKRCHYCDFYKTTNMELMSLCVFALAREMELRSDYLEGKEIETIYVGGGTPSLLHRKQAHLILESIKTRFKTANNTEITIEVNPEDITPTVAGDLIKTGFNRVSVGVQSWNNKVLRSMNRRHTCRQAHRAIDNLQDAGFTNISLDLIYGIPGLTSQEWEADLDITFKKNIKHLSCYHLTIEPSTVFGSMKEKGLLSEIDEEESERQFSILTTRTREMGFVHYEISNFCLEGYYSKHNRGYWEQSHYLGIGPSAHSFNGYSREWNISDIRGYLKSIGMDLVPSEREILDEGMKYNEYIMTSLRTMWGIEPAYIDAEFGKEMYDYLINMASRYFRYGLLEKVSNGRIVLTTQGKMTADNIIKGLMK
ncbi:MAG: radical SAM family heme chaperone HemW [Bacteroidales bacterium]|nr:radical SAM family heme chaperone HemW [Bacteroidales bacterium]